MSIPLNAPDAMTPLTKRRDEITMSGSRSPLLHSRISSKILEEVSRGSHAQHRVPFELVCLPPYGKSTFRDSQAIVIADSHRAHITTSKITSLSTCYACSEKDQLTPLSVLPL